MRKQIELILMMIGLSMCLADCTSQDAARESSAPLYIRDIKGDVFDTLPVYGEALPLRHRRGGFEYRCTECHTDFESTRTSNDPMGEHAELTKRFNHGRNIYCLNCHHQSNRDVFVDYVGGEIPSEDSAELCAKCHGPIQRDWEKGIHGRQNGYWDASMGIQRTLECVQCHDPHDPAFPLMKPDPPPIRSRFVDAKKEAKP